MDAPGHGNALYAAPPSGLNTSNEPGCPRSSRRGLTFNTTERFMDLGKQETVVVGGGLVGSLLSMMLVRRGLDVAVFERHPDMRSSAASAGRSINLVATARGIAGLERVGLRETVLQRAVPVLGRMMHAHDGTLTYQPYGKDESECNYSVSRGELNQILMTHAEQAGVRFHFEHRLSGADLGTGVLEFEDGAVRVEATRVFGADGATSRLRGELTRLPGYDSSYDDLGHGYKELLIPADDTGGFRIEEHALHIWPRGHFMMMALPNLDGSFTVTLYLPQTGTPSFVSLDAPEEVRDLFEREFPDAIPLIPGLAQEFFENPAGRLGTVRCRPWTLEDRVALIGDAAHAIVPFFGQGMNCGFEDCVVLDEVLNRHGDHWKAAFDEYSTLRKPAADAIADMAIENFEEMRDHVGDPEFLLRKKVEHRLENAFPDEYRSRYSMVVYSQIPYHRVQEAGRIQSRILAEICAGIHDPEEAQLERARELIRERLSPFFRKHSLTLDY